SISSATSAVRNILSLGYDQSFSDKVGLQNNRLNIRNNNQWTILKDRLKLNAEVWYVNNVNTNDNVSGYSPRYPYEQVEKNGTALEASTASTLRREYTDTVGNGQLLDWKYRPLNELQGKLNYNKSNNQQLRFQVG